MSFKKKSLTLALSSALIASFSLSAHAEMVLKRGNGSEPQSLDPQIAEGVPSSHIQRDLFEGLTAEDQEANIIPGMAESWDISEDGKTYTFHLRDAKWTDGAPVTAEDFVYAWQRGVNPATGSNYAFILYPIKNAEAIAEGKMQPEELGAKVIDDKTIEVELEGPTPYFLGMLAHNVAYPVPKQTVEKYGDDWTRPENIVSNGAFKMQEWTPQSNITLVKSDSYWDKDAVKLDKVIFYPTEDQGSELKRYRAGEIDWTYEIPNDQIKWIQSNLADELQSANYLGTYYYGFNTSKPPFDNKDLREALTLALDRDVITEKVTGAGETPAYSIVVPGVNNYDAYKPEWADWPRAEQIKKAKELYAKAGYGPDNPLKIELIYNTSDNHKKIAIAAASMWKQILGVETELVNQEWKVFLSTRKQGNTEAFRAGWIGDYNDPNSFLELFVSNSGLNDVFFKNEEFDSLLKQAASEQDAGKRAETLRQAEEVFTDSYSLAPIYHYVTKHMVKPYVKGYTNNVMDHNRSKYMYIEK
ncbi:peptide ABC transporter substrate-binding protein [Cardiobacteriaceae bacterium TAE3-ERU3]|nr:peptide ABC transporter substrate-binding protein [Cardiobacteriaceae bacterium TAE3-ERU3]